MMFVRANARWVMSGRYLSIGEVWKVLAPVQIGEKCSEHIMATYYFTRRKVRRTVVFSLGNEVSANFERTEEANSGRL